MAGLTQQLITNIKNIPACNVDVVTQILEWHDTGSTGTGNPPYIVTKCYGSMESGKYKDQITARYFYQQKDNAAITDAEVVNVLGVLVPQSFFNGDYTSAAKFDKSDWQAQTPTKIELPEGNKLTIGIDYYVNASSAVNNVSPLDPTKAVFSNKSLYPSASPQSLERSDTIFTRNLYVPSYSNPLPNTLQLKTSFPLADFWNNQFDANKRLSNNFYTFMRTIDSDGYAYVWTDHPQ